MTHPPKKLRCGETERIEGERSKGERREEGENRRQNRTARVLGESCMHDE